ncbi:GroES-like protein [Setomelanomma holmii]|uniref:GroES-like protein n=1 Tax=Setomelanomma holmii TaxID=210430 RepID=A0A9P4H7K9_9PLEO|nr:GroES-like protein [Setomelanomma holmii]
MVNAAVVQTWGEAPKYTTINLPEPTPTQVRIKVLAAGVHTLVRSRAAGKHFSVANTSPPHIPGTDGVGSIVGSNELIYFQCLTAPTGSFADEINVEKRDVFKLPDNVDPDAVAVIGNPAMSSWLALTARAGIAPGQEKEFTVAIVGATGVSGQAAVQIAKAVGAKKIVAIGKPGAKLEKTKELGATATIALAAEGTDFTEAADVDGVLDYLWGDVAKVVLPNLVAARENKSQRLTWVEIGALAGDDLPVSASLLRKANAALLGCGPGSWTFPELYAQLPTMLKLIASNGLKAEHSVKKLADVETWWSVTDGPRILVRP